MHGGAVRPESHGRAGAGRDLGPGAAAARTAAVRPGAGFALYLAGNITIFELAAGLPRRAPSGACGPTSARSAGVAAPPGTGGPTPSPPNLGRSRRSASRLRLEYEVVNRIVSATKRDLSRVHTVPDPYYVTNGFERATESKVIQFVNLPADCIIRIYSSSGILVSMLEHHSATYGGSERWNVLNRNNQVVASGVYFYHVEAGDARRVGRFVVVNFAQ